MAGSKAQGTGQSELALHVTERTERSLRVYNEDAERLREDAGKEEDLRHGGYGQRQILELVQNGADQLLNEPGGTIRVVLTEETLYCANQGAPIDADGITSLLYTHISPKRGDEIGRFGLGFKSVLGVSDSPQFFSREVSFGFDAEWAREEIQKIVPKAERYPVLRLAKVLDLDEEMAGDPVLSELMAEATTVVRLPRDAGQSPWLSEDLGRPAGGSRNRGFPAEFLLFSPHVGSVVLEDRTTDLRREIGVSEEDGKVTVHEAGEGSRAWRVFRTTIEPSAMAKKEAGELSGRDQLPVVWAVPVEGKLEVGQFWAFFPLKDETTLSGIANAPWKVNDDRIGLLPDSILNTELIDALSKLALESLPLLAKEDDPGWVLDLLPARGRETRNWGDEILTARVYELAPGYPLVPDQNGRLRTIRELSAPPEVPISSLEMWQAHPGRPDAWCHPSTNSSPTRRNRVDRLLEAVHSERKTVDEWLEALIDVDPDDPASSAAAVRVAADVFVVSEGDVKLHRQMRKAEVLMASDGRLVPLLAGHVFLPSPDYEPVGLVELVHAGLAEDPDTRAALEALTFVEVTPILELQALVRRGLVRRSDEAWDKFWKLVSLVEPQEAGRVLGETKVIAELRVRTRAGSYAPVDRVLLPGTVVPESGRDAAVAVDTEFHRGELDVLRRIGMGTAPGAGFPPEHDSLIAAYRDICRRDYQQTAQTASTPSWDYLVFDQIECVGPFAPLQQLGLEGRAAMTAALIAAVDDWGPWPMRHQTQDRYPPKDYRSPYLWAIEEHGALATKSGPVPVAEAVGPALAEWDDILPVCDLDPAACEIIGIPNSFEDLGDRWTAMFGRLDDITDDRLIGRFYSLAVEHGVDAPTRLRCRIGPTHEDGAPSEIVVTGNTSTFNALKDLGEAAVLAPSDAAADRIGEVWGLASAATAVSHEPTWIESGARVAALDAFPTLREDFRELGKDDLELVPCSDLSMVTTTERGTQADERDFVVHGSQIFYLDEIGTSGLLERLDRHFALDLSDTEREDLVSRTWEDQRRKKLAKIHDEPDDAARLLMALGEDALRKRLPIGLVAAVEDLHGPVSPHEVARLHLVVNGYDALKNLRDEFEAAGLHPPERWGGSYPAKSFVRDLGFPVEYAGFRSSKRDATLLVPGPSSLPPLHDYQVEMVEEIHLLLTKGGAHPRGMLSLPTGAGKTRIAVQALVEALVRGEIDSPVLWVAQSDELCEQAVGAWSEVWRAHGSDGELTVSRLWGPNEVSEAESDHQVVVATPDKLRGRTTNDSYLWLKAASCVVIDEAHTATAPDYTKLLEWQGISQRGGTTKTRAPLIGLTATPFRGTSKEETERLVNRFGKLRLDKDMGEKPYEEMQEMGILAQVDAEALDGGAVELDSDAIKMFKQMRTMPKAVLRGIASDTDRNRTIIESIRSKDADWPILLFAVSTEHAHTLAAMLTMEGIPSASIDHNTDGGLRRRLVQEFRDGDIRVLANYNVLSQGFDAPKTRAIYITRPTFSPNVYQQMIGRGLRGPLNGGGERCQIVNVVDNWSRFGDQLAYLEFEHLWTRRDGDG